MILPIVSKLCWAIRHTLLFFINLSNKIFFENEYWTPLLYYAILAAVILIPCLTMFLWCCLAVDEYFEEEESKDVLRRILREAEEARGREDKQFERRMHEKGE